MAVSTKLVLGFASERDAVLAGAVFGETADFDAFPLVVLEANGQWFLECYDNGGLSAISFPGVEIIAADIDPIAIAVARANCRNNGAAGSVRLFVGDGLKPALAYARAPFDAVMANILAKPFLKLAPRLRQLTKRGGILI